VWLRRSFGRRRAAGPSAARLATAGESLSAWQRRSCRRGAEPRAPRRRMRPGCGPPSRARHHLRRAGHGSIDNHVSTQRSRQVGSSSSLATPMTSSVVALMGISGYRIRKLTRTNKHCVCLSRWRYDQLGPQRRRKAEHRYRCCWPPRAREVHVCGSSDRPLRRSQMLSTVTTRSESL
jgi:hypothetical protein